MGNQAFLEILIGRLYIEMSILKEQNLRLTNELQKRNEEYSQLVELTNKISLPTYNSENNND